MAINDVNIINSEGKYPDQHHSIAIVGSNRLNREILSQTFPKSIKITYSKFLCAAIKQIESKNSLSAIILIVESKTEFEENIHLIKEFCNQNKTCKWIILSDSRNAEIISEALRFGANAFLSKEISMHTMHKIIELLLITQSSISITPDLLSADIFFSNEILRLSYEKCVTLPSQMCDLPFTPREQEICKLLMSGYSNKEIAGSLKISEATVKVYLKKLLRKTGLKNRTQAAVWLLAQNLKN